MLGKYYNKNIAIAMNTFNSISKKCYQAKAHEDIVSKIHKHNIHTITMGFPDLYGRYIGKKYDSDYFADV